MFCFVIVCLLCCCCNVVVVMLSSSLFCFVYCLDVLFGCLDIRKKHRCISFFRVIQSSDLF